MMNMKTHERPFHKSLKELSNGQRSVCGDDIGVSLLLLLVVEMAVLRVGRKADRLLRRNERN